MIRHGRHNRALTLPPQTDITHRAYWDLRLKKSSKALRDTVAQARKDGEDLSHTLTQIALKLSAEKGKRPSVVDVLRHIQKHPSK